MRTRLVFTGALLCLSSPLFAASRPLLDYDFGTQAVAWKNDGSQLALQDPHGIAIRDARTLRLARYFPIELRDNGLTVLRAWTGDNLVLDKVADADVQAYGWRFKGDRTVWTRALIMSAQTGNIRAIWQGVWFSPETHTLWFHRGSHFRILDLTGNRWFDVDLPLRRPLTPQERELHQYDWPSVITFSADGRFAADQLPDGRMRLWDVATHKTTVVLKDKRLPVAYAYAPVAGPVSWSPDGKRVATLGEDPTHSDFTYDDGGPNDGTQNEHPAVVKIWDAHSGEQLQWFSAGYIGWSLPFAWSDNDHLIIEGDGIWMRHVSKQTSSMLALRSPLALSPGKSHLFTGERLMKMGKNSQNSLSKALFPAPSTTSTVAWSRDGRFIAVPYNIPTANGGFLSRNLIWDISKLSLEQTKQPHKFLPWGGRIYEYEWSSTTVVGEVSEFKGGSILAFSPDSKKVLRLGKYGVRIFDRQDHVLASLTSSVRGINSAQFSPDGKYIALVRDNFVELYDAQSARLVAKLYTWVKTNSTQVTDWLSLRPNGETKGTEAARKQVVLVP